ncbi:OPT oligopeptide transporter protein-domain-containing protein [Butyriboletus roseoflavus]|nr:OPT oligopeptide transporter protein-domain-containing protein [Butyriboletus roseoflavus]
MDEEEAFIQKISDAHPGYTSFITHLTTLASTYLPPFIYVTDANNPRVTTLVIDAIFQDVSSIPDAPPTLYAHVNAVACFTPRIFYDTVLNTLARWKPSWEDGCQVWPGDDPQRYNDSIDSFLHGLRRLRLERTGDPSKRKGKGKGKAVDSSNEQNSSMVILIERAERLSEGVPELIVPLSRLAELSRIKVSVILLSSVSWENIRPALGASPDPYYVNVESLAKQNVIQRLVSAFRSTSSSDTPHVTCHPALQPLYEQYVETLYNAVSIYTTDPLELQYVAAARWPGFVKPVISQYEELFRQAEEEGSDPPELEPPGTDGRLRLFKFFLPTFTAALDALYPRLDNAADWAANHDYDAGQTSATSNRDGLSSKVKPIPGFKVDHLPRMSKFILIAAFLASANPPKSDIRMFSRGPEERRKKRRKSSSPKKSGGVQTVVKASQRLLGPATFPLDRLLAILGSLLEENDYETRPHDPRFELPGEYTDMEIGRIYIYAKIAELTLMRALHRTSAMDKLDGPPMFKCGISYDVALALARDLDVPLNDLITPSHEYFAEVQTIGSQNKEPEPDDHVRTLHSGRSCETELTSEFDDPNLEPNRAVEFDDDSPYPEVRSAVANTDDPSIPVMTLRTWVLGLAWSVLIPGVNQFLFFRYPAVPVVGIVAQLISYPLGSLMAAYMPRKRIFGISLNPGPFSIKEHVLITIMASVGSPSAYATDIIAVQRVYYNQRFSFTYQWLLVVSTQLIGFSAGGIARRFLVVPASMIWPTTLVSCALFNTLHSQQYAGSGRLGGISRERFFLYAFAASYTWYFVPGYLFQGLSYFSWVTWIWPENAVIAQLFGYIHGMGMSVLTFDWSQIAYIGSPLATPWWAAANILFGFVVFYWIVTPILYFTNTWMSLYMPIQSRQVFDNTMHPYNVTRILTPQVTLDMNAYKSYSPVFMSLSFATITATLVHTFLHFRKQIIRQSQRSLREEPDIHARLMTVYPQGNITAIKHRAPVTLTTLLMHP